MKDYRKSHIRKGYGKSYNSIYEGDTFQNRLLILEREVILRIFHSFFATKKIEYLDFACGTGRIIKILENKVGRSVGIDISNDMVSEMKQSTSKFYLHDITREDIEIGKFELITAFRFFSNAQKDLRIDVLKKLKKYSKKRNILIFNIHCNRFGPDNWIKKILGKKSKQNYRSFKEVKKELNSQNYEIVKVIGIGFIPSYFYKFIPRRLWLIIERLFSKINILSHFALDMIFVCRMTPKIQKGKSFPRRKQK